jgi:hypothetical protein
VPFPKGTYLLLPNDPKFDNVGPLIITFGDLWKEITLAIEQ